MDRTIRGLVNSKQAYLHTEEEVSGDKLADGQVVMSKGSGRQPVLAIKKDGKVYKANMSYNGNHVVDRSLIAHTIKYTNKFIDYRCFSHNFNLDLDTTEIYLPWYNTGELTTLRPAVGFLTPFKATCHKLIFKPPNLDDNADNITFAIKKIDDGDATTDSLCNYTYSTTFVDNTSVTINKSDWSASPTVDAGDVIAITVTASHADIVTSAKDFWVTSVWKMEIVV